MMHQLSSTIARHTNIDRDEVTRAIRLLVPAGEVFEIRALHAVVRGDRRTHKTVAGYFNDVEAAVNAVATIEKAKGIYIVLNRPKPELLARCCNRLAAPGEKTTSDADVVKRCWFYIDFDAERPSEISANESEHKGAHELARGVAADFADLGWPDPIYADSGNGAHLLYAIDLPADDGGLIEKCVNALAQQYNGNGQKVDTTVFNESRICKLYGTRACKGDEVGDRVHRMSRIINAPETVEVVPVELLQSLAAKYVEPQKAVATTTTNGTYTGPEFDIEAFIAKHLPGAKEAKPWRNGGWIRELSVCPFNADHNRGEAWVGKQAGGGLAAGCQHQSCKWGWRELRAMFEPKQERAADRRHIQPNHSPIVSNSTAPAEGSAYRTKPIIIEASAVTPRKVDWLWYNRFARGKLNLLAGMPGLGKSTVTCDIAARVSTGSAWPDNAFSSAPCGGVVMLNCEDDVADTIVPRLIRHSADLTKIRFVDGVVDPLNENKERHLNLADDLHALEAAVEATPDCRLIVIDPISAYLGKVDSHKNADVRAVLAPLAAMAAKHNAAVIAVSHLNKGAGSALNRIMGSLAFSAAARAAYCVVQDNDDAGLCLFVPAKNNIAPNVGGLSYRVVGGDGAGVIEWQEGIIDKTADEALAAIQPSPDADAESAAKEFLLTTLADGAKLTKEVEADARDGHGISQRTLFRARKALGIESYRVTNKGPWWLSLPTTLPHPDLGSVT